MHDINEEWLCYNIKHKIDVRLKDARKVHPKCLQWRTDFGVRCMCVITDVFPLYVVYITAFDALIALLFLYRSHGVQEVLTYFLGGSSCMV